MKEFDLFASKYPPEYSLRKPTAVMLAQFRGIASRASGLLAGIRVRKLRGRPPKVWALTFFSLTKDEILGYLEYHRVLQRLRPYILETRDGHILLRGLSLKEMELVLSAQ